MGNAWLMKNKIAQRYKEKNVDAVVIISLNLKDREMSQRTGGNVTLCLCFSVLMYLAHMLFSL